MFVFAGGYGTMDNVTVVHGGHNADEVRSTEDTTGPPTTTTTVPDPYASTASYSPTGNSRSLVYHNYGGHDQALKRE